MMTINVIEYANQKGKKYPLIEYKANKDLAETLKSAICAEIKDANVSIVKNDTIDTDLQITLARIDTLHGLKRFKGSSYYGRLVYAISMFKTSYDEGEKKVFYEPAEDVVLDTKAAEIENQISIEDTVETEVTNSNNTKKSNSKR